MTVGLQNNNGMVSGNPRTEGPMELARYEMDPSIRKIGRQIFGHHP